MINKICANCEWFTLLDKERLTNEEKRKSFRRDCVVLPKPVAKNGYKRCSLFKEYKDESKRQTATNVGSASKTKS